MGYKGKRAKEPERRPWEFKKKLAAWAVVIATAAAVASYVLAFKDKQTASDVTNTIFTAASATEKVSRNRHGIDADGRPFNTSNATNTTTEGGSNTGDPPSVG